jgi:hypothetical protein
MKKVIYCAVCLVVLASVATPQDCKKAEYGADQQKYMETALQKFTGCQLPLDGGCRGALAQALDQIYSVKDFNADSKSATPAEIGRKAAAEWEHLGAASDQEALKKAQAAANCGRATVAVMSSETGGHVAIILPGPLTTSNGWKLQVPNSASFFTHNPSKSFSGKPLSYSFPKADGVELYAKK